MHSWDTQRGYVSKEESDVPIVATEAMIIARVIESKEDQDVTMLDIPDAFLETFAPTDSERTIMKIRGMLVDMLVEIPPKACKHCVAYDGKNNKLLHISMLKPSHDMIKEDVLHRNSLLKTLMKFVMF